MNVIKKYILLNFHRRHNGVHVDVIKNVLNIASKAVQVQVKCS